MRRGSLVDWEEYGRRTSSNMRQFAGSPSEFMTSENIEYGRSDGWFVSYKKITLAIVAFMVGIVVAGFIGWYLSSTPRKRVHNALNLASEDFQDGDVTRLESTVSPYIHPLKYRVELTPVIDVKGFSKMLGQVLIEFQINEGSLDRLSLNARNITVISYKLKSLNQDETLHDIGQRKKRSPEESNGNDTVTSPTKLENGESTSRSSSKDNETTTEAVVNVMNGSDNETDYQKANVTLSDKRNATDDVAIVKNNSIDDVASRFDGNSTLEQDDKKALKTIDIKKYEIEDEKEMHLIYTADRIKSGKYSLEIHYETPVDGGDIYSSNYTGDNDDRWFFGTSFKPTGARHLLPIFDDISLKTVFEISVVHGGNMKVITNMPLRISKSKPSNQVTDTFEETPMISPHNLALFMGKFESIGTFVIPTKEENLQKNITFWGNVKKDFDLIYISHYVKLIIDYWTDLLSVFYPLPKLDVVALPSGVMSETGNPGLIGIRSSSFYATHQSPLTSRTKAVRSLIRLMGQSWYGALVDMKNWTDSWIIESSILYHSYLIQEKIDPKFETNEYFVADVQSSVMDVDGFASKSLNANVNLFNFESNMKERYQKGACVIRMLHGIINDTVLRSVNKEFINRWQNKSSESKEFWNIVKEQLSNHTEIDIDLIKFVDSWIIQKGYPVVSVTRDYEKGSVQVRQNRFAYHNLSLVAKTPWHVPLTYTTENGSWQYPKLLWLDTENEKVINDVVDSNNGSWILFNVNKTGYYRINYDEENWNLLAEALEKNHELFPPSTRASLVDDVFSLAAVGLVKYETAFNIIKYMKIKERNYGPWKVFTDHILKLSNLLYETMRFAKFQEFVMNLISPLYSEMKTKIEEGSPLTLIAIKFACMFDHQECLDWSESIEKSKTNTSIEDRVPGYIAEVLYCTIARYATRQDWYYLLEKSTTISDREEKYRLLSSLACYQTPWFLQSTLDEIMLGKSFNDADIRVILHAFAGNPLASRIVFRFFRSNWQDVVRRFSKSHRTLQSFILAMANGMTNKQDLEDLQDFIDNNYDTIIPVRHSLAVVEAKANFHTSWLNRSLSSLEKCLTPNETII